LNVAGAGRPDQTRGRLCGKSEGSHLEQSRVPVVEAPTSRTVGDEAQMIPDSPAPPVVALFNASDDTVEMVQRMLVASGVDCLVNCRFADLRKRVVDFAGYLREHDPHVVIFDISPPYEQNWAFFRTFRDDAAMRGRGLVLTTTNKDRLDEVAGHDSLAIEVVGKPYDLQQIRTAIVRALAQARRNRPADGSPEGAPAGA
jgi:DNA-binding response OmpR family regulator